MKNIIDNITDLFAWYESQVKIKSKLHLFDIHQRAENFFRDLINMMYGWDLQNSNYTNVNAQAIDLESERDKISIQVTSDNSKTKIDHTIEGFFDTKTGYNKKYNRLILLIFGEKNTNANKYEKEYTNKYRTLIYSFSFEIWDIHTLTKEINNYQPNKQKQVLSHLNEYISPIFQKEYRKECNEVETIKYLIDYLSNTDLETEIKSKIDPENKIEHHFKDYAQTLKNEYTELYSIYGNAIEESKKSSNLDALSSKKIAAYLKRKSDNELTQQNGNPIIALDKLTEFFKEKISKAFIKYDENAIRFYLVNQLTHCIVFPLK